MLQRLTHNRVILQAGVTICVPAISVVCNMYLVKSWICICFFIMRPPTGICFWNDSYEPPPPNQLSQCRNNALRLSVRSLAKIFHCVREAILHYDAIIILARSLCASVGGNPSTFEKFIHIATQFIGRNPILSSYERGGNVQLWPLAVPIKYTEKEIYVKRGTK